MQGKIVKGIAGFYYVDVKNVGVIECKARGRFRKQKITPLIGDEVIISVGENNKGAIDEILERHNQLVRPTVSNVDQAIIVFAVKNPVPHFSLLDRFLILAIQQDIDVTICLNKSDLMPREQIEEMAEVYEKAGFKVLVSSTTEGIGKETLHDLLADKTTVFAGPSGVGKSSILNMISPELALKTGEISQKIKRGKHTTRHAELLTLPCGGYVVDTPGFSSLELYQIPYEDLKDYYVEFDNYEDQCKFKGCIHIHEPQCGVKDAVERGDIAKQRYENYLALYDELKDYQDRNRWK